MNGLLRKKIDIISLKSYSFGRFFIIVMLRGVFFAVFSSRILCYTQKHLCSI